MNPDTSTYNEHGLFDDKPGKERQKIIPLFFLTLRKRLWMVRNLLKMYFIRSDFPI